MRVAVTSIVFGVFGTYLMNPQKRKGQVKIIEKNPYHSDHCTTKIE